MSSPAPPPSAATDATALREPTGADRFAPHPTQSPVHATILGLVTAATVLLALGASRHVDTSGMVRKALVFGHLVFLVVGFGATFAIDLHGVLWLIGRRTSAELRRMVMATHVLVWVGVYGLVATGAFLSPSLERTRIQMKIAFVLIAIANGAWGLTFLHELRTLPADVPASHRPAVMWRAVLSAVLSQACWWGATLVGFLTTMSRRG
jgi:hypothetical protein